MSANPKQKEFVFPNACSDPQKKITGLHILFGIFVFLFVLSGSLAFFGDFFDAFFEMTNPGTSKTVGIFSMIAVTVAVIALTEFAIESLKTVVVRDGRVYICNDKSATIAPIFEAPYESFCELSVAYIPGGEGTGPEYSVYLHYKFNDGLLAKSDPKIRLICLHSGEQLSMADRETVYELAEEMQIPIRDNPRKNFLSKLLS